MSTPRLFPGQFPDVFLGQDLDLCAVDDDRVFGRRDVSFEPAEHGVIFQEMGERFGVGDIVDGEIFDFRIPREARSRFRPIRPNPLIPTLMDMT